MNNNPYLWSKCIDEDDILFIWEHGEKKLRDFVQNLNEIQPAIKFTAKWSQKSVNFLDVTVSLIERHIETDVYVKLIDSRQYLHSSSCHPYHCKKSIPYCQVLHFFFERLVRKEILNARSQPRETLFNKEKMSRNDGRVTCTITYYPVFKKIRIVLEEMLFYLHQMSSIKNFLQIFSE